MPWVDLQYVLVVFSGHAHLLLCNSVFTVVDIVFRATFVILLTVPTEIHVHLLHTLDNISPMLLICLTCVAKKNMPLDII